jgi:uncharacterized glyoxalase superfamily protein PhnB
LNPATLRWLANASCSNVWGFTTSACVPIREKDVDRCAALLKEMGATIVRGPQEGTWAPGYYYVLFEDPDGIRLEVNFVPGAGVLADGTRFNPTTGYI